MIGNDDCGQMSAWYILSTLGFYPVNPANGEFVLGAPQVKNATIHLKNNKKFSISTSNFSAENIYTNHQKLNNTEVSTPIINYSDIIKGGTLNFQMTNQY
jgi:putative alpha-1,2-mannosidase